LQTEFSALPVQSGKVRSSGSGSAVGSLSPASSLMTLAAAPNPLLLTAANASLTANTKRLLRQKLTLLNSRDVGKSWTQEIVLDEGVSGYSDLQFASDGGLLYLYEAGANSNFVKCLRISGVAK